MTDLLLPAVMLVAGLGLLWWAGDRSVRYAVELTELLGISSFAVGFIVLSIGTGLPEIMTAILSSVEHVAELSAGDLIGSSLVNLSLVLGISVIAAGRLAVEKEDELTLLKALAVITLLASGILVTAHLTVWHGAILLAAYAGSLWLLQRSGLMHKIVKEEEEEAVEELEEETFLTGPYGTATKFLGSLVFVLIGARLTVNASVTIGSSMGIPLETLGATVVAIGTGLPEITLELNAVKRREYALALGDIFGSTLVNLTLVLGLLSIISPVPLDTVPLLGTVLYMGVTLAVLWWTMLRNHGLERKHGILLIFLFVLYLVEEIGVLTFVYHAL